MKISVVIPNYNGGSLLQPCLKSLLRQTYLNYEILVVDNGSTDSSAEILQSYAPHVRVCWLPQNLGFGRAVNIGIQQTEGELLLILNNDTVVEENCLKEIINAVDTNKEYGIFAPLILEHNQANKAYAIGLMYSTRGYGNRSERHHIDRFDCKREVFGACGAAAVYKREILEEVGLFNERFFVLHEDVELSFRHQLAGQKCLFVPDAIVTHVGSATLRKDFSLVVRETVKNSLSTVLTCMPSPLLIKYGLEIPMFYLTFLSHLIRKGYSTDVCWGILGLVLSVPSLCISRRRIQRTRRVSPGSLEELLYRGPIYLNFPNETVVI